MQLQQAPASASALESIWNGCAIVRDAIDRSNVVPGQTQKKPRHEPGTGSNELRLSGDVIGILVTDHIRSLYKRVRPAMAKYDLDKLLTTYRG